MDNSIMSEDYEPPKKKRIRARLDHLSPNEKLQRRKMKNRIAAQTARDRKRAKIDHLEEENRRLREENQRLRSQLQAAPISETSRSSNNITDSGLSDIDSELKTPSNVPTRTELGISMDTLSIPKEKMNNFPLSPASSVSGVYSTTTTVADSADCIDSIVCESNESTLIDDILRLQDTLFGEPGTTSSIGSEELINKPQKKVQEGSFQSRSVENSAGWTSIQLMLLLMISRVHHLYSSKINCCVKAHETSMSDESRSYHNLYDYISHSRCKDFRRATEAIIRHKNIRNQRLVALQFVYKYIDASLVKPNFPYISRTLSL